MKRNIALLMVAAAAATLGIAQAAEIGHFNGGVTDHTSMPNQGFYGTSFNSDSLNQHLHSDIGKRINFVAMSTPVGMQGIDVDLNLYTFVPAVIWISPYTILGAEYGGHVGAFLADDSWDLFSGTAGVRNSRFGSGDLYARAGWLDWAKEHWDFLLSYGFRTPAASTDRTDAPESKDGIGLGYSAPDARAGVAWYPMTNKATAVTLAWTYEYNPGHEYFDVRPGQMFTVSWNVSQRVPLRKNHELLLEAGPAAYDTCQITDSTGGNALADAPRSHIQALGGEVGLTYTPWNAFLTFRSFYEYAAKPHFQGASVGFNFEIKF